MITLKWRRHVKIHHRDPPVVWWFGRFIMPREKEEMIKRNHNFLRESLGLCTTPEAQERHVRLIRESWDGLRNAAYGTWADDVTYPFLEECEWSCKLIQHFPSENRITRSTPGELPGAVRIHGILVPPETVSTDWCVCSSYPILGFASDQFVLYRIMKTGLW